jgi:hypothetical protein
MLGTLAEAHTYEYGLPPGYYKYLTTGAVPAYLDGKPDMRIYYDGKDVNHQVGPYQLTNTVNPTGPTLLRLPERAAAMTATRRRRSSTSS